LVTAVWSGGIGDWTNPGHWSTNPNYPNNTATVQYDVRFGAGTAQFTPSTTISALSLTGGAIVGTTGNSILTVDGPMTWTGGSPRGLLALQVKGELAINGATPSTPMSYGRDFLALGSVTWSSGRPLGTTGGVSFYSYGSFDAQFDGTWNLGGLGNFYNHGVFVKSGGSGVARYQDGVFTTFGSVRIDTGELSVDRYSQRGGTTDPAGNVISVVENSSYPIRLFELQGGKLIGNGSINANVSASGTGAVAPGYSAATSSLTLNGDMSMLGNSALEFDLGGVVQSTLYDHVDVNGRVNVGGSLQPRFANGFEDLVSAADTFTVLTADAPITGAFANLIGGRVNTADLEGSFAVHFGANSPFGPNSLVLTDFSETLVPEPSAAGLFAALALAASGRRRAHQPKRRGIRAQRPPAGA
jgi:hypothetical protein